MRLAFLLLVAVLASLLVIGSSAAAPPVIETRLALIGSGGGKSFTRRCPDDHVLTGLRWRTGMVIDAIGIRCRPVRLSGHLGDEISVGSMAGGNGGSAGSESCNQQNPSVIASQYGGGAGIGIAKFSVECKEWLPESRAFGVGNRWIFSVRNGTVMISSAACGSSNSPAVGIYGRHGSFIDAMGLICDKP